jgi:hypothetical protein
VRVQLRLDGRDGHHEVEPQVHDTLVQDGVRHKHRHRVLRETIVARRVVRRDVRTQRLLLYRLHTRNARQAEQSQSRQRHVQRATTPTRRSSAISNQSLAQKKERQQQAAAPPNTTQVAHTAQRTQGVAPRTATPPHRHHRRVEFTSVNMRRRRSSAGTRASTSNASPARRHTVRNSQLPDTWREGAAEVATRACQRHTRPSSWPRDRNNGTGARVDRRAAVATHTAQRAGDTPWSCVLTSEKSDYYDMARIKWKQTLTGQRYSSLLRVTSQCSETSSLTDSCSVMPTVTT